MPKFLRRRAAATYLTEVWGLPCAPTTLAKRAVVGGGPAFHSAGRTVLYAIEELDRYARERIGGSHRTTSERKHEVQLRSQDEASLPTASAT
jgi:hypothetical protein